MASASSSSAVRTQLTRALSLLVADARAAKVPLPVPFRSCSIGEGEGGGDRASSSSSTSSTSSTSSSSSSSSSLLLRATLGDDASDLDASFARLRRLREQLEFLASAPPDVRHSLSLWRQLQEEGEEIAGGKGVLLSSEALAFERGALLLPSVARPPGRLELGGLLSSSSDDDEDKDEEEEDEEEMMSAERVSAALDDAALAASDALSAENKENGASSVSGVRSLARLLFDGSASAPASGSAQTCTERLLVVPRLRPAAVEWLYDGLDPLFPGRVLRRGQRLVLSSSGSGSGSSNEANKSKSVGVGAGAPIALAAVASAIARRLGVWSVPVPAEKAASKGKEKGNGSAAAASVPQSLSPLLSPSVAARMAARTPAAAPETGKWLLVCPLGEWVWDPSTGEVVVGEGEVERKWPLAGFLTTTTRSGSGGNQISPPPSFSLPPTSSDPRVGWSSMLRACVVAHTRRGDSDAVAAVLPQLLALDAEAPEWGQVLRASEVVAAGRRS